MKSFEDAVLELQMAGKKLIDEASKPVYMMLDKILELFMRRK